MYVPQKEEGAATKQDFRDYLRRKTHEVGLNTTRLTCNDVWASWGASSPSTVW